MMGSSQYNRSPLKQPEDRPPQNALQLIWGVALFLMGLAVIFRMPVVIDKISGAGQLSSGLYFLRFCFYLIAVILMGGGIKKINRFRISANTKNHPVNKDENTHTSE